MMEFEKEINLLKKALKEEETQRDQIEEENRKKAERQKVHELKQSLEQESKERDDLENEATKLSQNIKKMESNMMTAQMEKNRLEDELSRAKEARERLQRTADNSQREHEQEVDQLRDELRNLRRENREKLRKLENDNDDLQRQLKKASNNKRQEQEIQQLKRDLSDKESQLKLQMSRSTLSLSSSSSLPTFDQKAINEVLEQKKTAELERDKMAEKFLQSEEQITRLKKEISGWESQRKEVEEEKTKLRQKSKSLDEERETMQKEIGLLQEELKSVKKELKEAGDFAVQNVKQGQENKEQIEELKQSLQETNHKRELAEQDKEDLEMQFSHAKVEWQELQHEYMQKIQELAGQLQHHGESANQELHSQIQTLSRDLQDVTKQMEEGKKTIAQLREEINIKNGSLRTLESQLQQDRQDHQTELDKLRRKLEKENQELDENLKIALQKVEKLTHINEELGRQHKEMQSKEGPKALQKERFLLEMKETKENLLVAAKEKQTLEEQLQELKLKSETLKNKNSTLTKENESLSKQLELKDQQLQTETSKLKQNFERTIKQLESGTEEAREERNKVSSQLDTANKDIQMLKLELEKIQKRLSLRTEELEQISQTSQKTQHDLQMQLKELQSQQMQSSSKQQKTTLELEQSLLKTEQERNKLQTELKQIKEELEELQKDLKQNKKTSEESTQKAKQLENQLRQSQEQFKDLSRKCELLTKQTESDGKTLISKNETIKELTEKCHKVEQDLNLQLEESKNKLSIHKNESQVLSHDLEMKVQEIKRLEIENKNLSEQLQLEKQTSSQSKKEGGEVGKLKEQITDLLGKVQSLEQTKERHQHEIEQLSTERQKRNTKLNQAKERKTFWKKKTRESEGIILELKKGNEELQQKSQNLQQNLSSIEEEKKQLEDKLSNNQELAQLRLDNERLRQQLQGSSEVGISLSDLPEVGPRLVVPRKPLGPRQIRKGLVSQTVPIVKSEPEPEIEPSPQVPSKPDPTRLGGISLFGGIGVNQLPSLKKTTAVSPVSPRKQPSKKKLWCLKGRRRIRAFLVEPSFKGLNSGDVFLLESGDKIFQWNGAECNRMERTKGKDMSTRLNRQKGNRCEVVTIDEGDDDENMAKFWIELGGKGPVKSSKEGGDDLEAEQELDAKTKMFHVQDDFTLSPVEGKLVMELLNPSRCFVMDCGNEVYVWTGKSSDRDLRTHAINLSLQLFESEPREEWAEHFKEVQGGESPWFCEKFSNWNEGATFINVGTPSSPHTRLAETGKQQEGIDVVALHNSQPPEQNSLRKPVEWSSDCKLEIWKVVDALKEEHPINLYGQFWSSHSYIVQLQYGPPSDPLFNVYFWQGRLCAKNEKGTSAALALNLAKKLPGANQIRIIQNKETPEFLGLFQGKFVVHLGKDSDPKGDVSLYHTRGSVERGVSSFQVPASMQRLNSADSFVLLDHNNKKSFVWKGKHSHSVEQAASIEIARKLMAEPIVLEQDHESSEFILRIGGLQPYIKDAHSQKIKFYQFTNRTGTLSLDRIWDWSQDDLEFIVLLDTFDTVYLWISKNIRETDKRFALETAVEFVEKAPDNRPKDIPITQVLEGQEPLAFVTLFHGWDKTIVGPKGEKLRRVQSVLREYSVKYPYEQLINKANLPETVDKSRLEDYLSDKDFFRVFGMDRLTFEKQASWKKTKLKQEKKLY